MQLPHPQEIQEIRSKLLAYYDAHKRDLPWRKTSDPYKIWVSEIMLQQTQVKTVIPRWHQFLERFPSVEHLASASEHEVCEAWAGLGYYRRARMLHKCAQALKTDYNGVWPRSAKELAKLPGLGPYTGGAISSIAFGAQSPVVDGNVNRVLTRLSTWEGDPLKPPLKNKIWEFADALVQGERPGDLNQAMMEQGALICTPRAPLCEKCFLQKNCKALSNGRVLEFPSAQAQPEKKSMIVNFAWIESSQGVWFKRRPLEGLWPGLWELPSCEGEQGRRQLMEKFGILLGPKEGELKHELTHRSVNARYYRAIENREEFSPQGEEWRCVKLPVESLGLSVLAKKIVEALS